MRLRYEFLRGVRWLGLAGVLSNVIVFSSSVILARILFPRDFGSVEAALVGFFALAVIADLGLYQALIQKKELDERHVQSAFWLCTFLGLAGSLLLMFSAPWMAWVFREPKVAEVTVILSPGVLIQALSGPPRSLLNRRLQFRAVALIEVVGNLTYAVSACVMAFAGFGVVSLVGAIILKQLVTASMTWGISRFRPRLRFSPSALGEMFPFSLPVLGSGLVGFVGARADIFLVGRGLGSGVLGVYNKAQNLVRFLGFQLSHAVHPTGLATLSRTQDDIEKLRRGYVDIVEAVSTLSIPALTGLFAVAPALILALYTDRWADVIPLVQILAPAGVFWALFVVTSPIILAVGRSGLLFVWNLIRILILVGAVIVGLWYGVEGVAVALVAHHAFSCIVSHWIVMRILDCRAGALLQVLWAPIIASGVMLGLLWILRLFITPESDPWLFVGISVPSGIVLYSLGMLAIRRRQLGKMLEAIREVLIPPSATLKS
jgi:PST family polysaccharide transporter